MEETEKHSGSQSHDNSLNAACDHDASDDCGTATENPQPTAEILKLDIDCCEEAFDYLTITEHFSQQSFVKINATNAGHQFNCQS